MNNVPHRTISLFGAIVVGISAMVGTGVFVAWSPAFELAGSYLLIALVIAAVVAALNATSNARLARMFPESGGGYLYGRECINPFVGQLAGWSFLIGKVASASAAALAIGIYLAPDYARYLSVASIAVVVLINVLGIRHSIIAMAIMISIGLATLMTLSVTAGVSESGSAISEQLPQGDVLGVFAGAGILFVAFAGYARIAVLGSEVKNAKITIPKAITFSLAVVLLIYFAIAAVLLRAPESLSSDTPLDELARLASYPTWLVSLAAVLAAGSALFALVAGLGRMIYAMSHGGNLPQFIGELTGTHAVPRRADLAISAVLIVITLTGSIAVNLAVSAVFVLIYYGVVHLSSWNRPGSTLLRRVIPPVGLVANSLVVGALIIVALSAR